MVVKTSWRLSSAGPAGLCRWTARRALTATGGYGGMRNGFAPPLVGSAVEVHERRH